MSAAPEAVADSDEALRAVLDSIRFEPSGVGLHTMALRWETEPMIQRNREHYATSYGPPFPDVPMVTVEPMGWRLRLTFLRPDRETGVIGRGAGRWELIERGTSLSSVVKTCWILLELLVRHELMESFTFDGVRVFDPHRTIAQLSGGGS